MTATGRRLGQASLYLGILAAWEILPRAGVIVAQMLGAAEGLGFLITRHRTLLNSPGVYAGIVLVLLITGLHEVLLRGLERRVAAYRQGG